MTRATGSVQVRVISTPGSLWLTHSHWLGSLTQGMDRLLNIAGVSTRMGSGGIQILRIGMPGS